MRGISLGDRTLSTYSPRAALPQANHAGIGGLGRDGSVITAQKQGYVYSVARYGRAAAVARFAATSTESGGDETVAPGGHARKRRFPCRGSRAALAR